MEKINTYEQEPDLIDGLLAIADSARRILLAMKCSRSVSKPTPEQYEMMKLLDILYTAKTSKERAQQLIDLKCKKLLAVIADGLAFRG